MHQIGWSNRYFGVTAWPVLALISITIPRASRAVTQKNRMILASFMQTLALNGRKKGERVANSIVRHPRNGIWTLRVRRAEEPGRTYYLLGRISCRYGTGWGRSWSSFG